jgi:hypothetical protein
VCESNGVRQLLHGVTCAPRPSAFPSNRLAPFGFLDCPRSLWKANFVGIIGDLPHPENRAAIDDNKVDGVVIKYTIKKELRDRTARLRELLAERLKERRLVFLSQNIELNFGHPCGTYVMSNDPSTGVVDRDCPAHGIHQSLHNRCILYGHERRNEPIPYYCSQCAPSGV